MKTIISSVLYDCVSAGGQYYSGDCPTTSSQQFGSFLIICGIIVGVVVGLFILLAVVSGIKSLFLSNEVRSERLTSSNKNLNGYNLNYVDSRQEQREEERTAREEAAKQEKDEKFWRDVQRGNTDSNYDKTNFFGAAYHENDDGSKDYKDGDGRPWWW